MIRVFVLLLVIIAANAVATTLPEVPLAELFDRSEAVVYVEVKSGQMIEVSDGLCGARYKARVIETFKGAQTNEEIEFGYYIGYGVGKRYVLFLSRTDKPFEPKMSSNAGIEAAVQKARALCTKHQPSLMVSHGGFGALEVQWASQFEYKDSVRVPSRYVGLPAPMPRKAAKAADHEDYSGLVWVPLVEFLSALKELSK